VNSRASHRCNRAIASLAIPLALASCGTFAVQNTAEPLPRGMWRGALVGSLQTLRDAEQKSTVPGGTLAIGIARGIGHNREVGATLYTLGIEGYGKVRVWPEPSLDAHWSFAVLAAVGGTQLPANGLISPGTEIHSRLVGLATVRTSACLAWSFGPSTAAYQFWPRGGGNEHGLWLGAFGNLAWQLSQHWTMLPELSLYRSVSGTFPVDKQLIQLSVGWSRTW
jgi:hypothetical protein